jgi:hypothetical protein
MQFAFESPAVIVPPVLISLGLLTGFGVLLAIGFRGLFAAFDAFAVATELGIDEITVGSIAGVLALVELVCGGT